ncbi:MAG: tagaturonate reductase [Chitinophagaceae bacterium]|nr:tagaturonate reductase [Chitinophagaceae bacterium]
MLLSEKMLPPYEKYPEKVLQFGEGNFLRCFVDWMFNDLNKKGSFKGSIAVVQPIENGMVDMLNAQDGLYTVYLRGLQNGKVENTHETITAISRGINPYTQFDAFIKTAENPDMRFVISNTTEAGISYNAGDMALDTPPASYPGKLAVWLFHRYRTFSGDTSKGVHVIPCELIDKNAYYLKKHILQLADNWKLDPAFTGWLNTACTFSNTLVDRIVPGYPKDRMTEITAELGYEDKQVVEGEPFHLWVIEAGETLEKELPFPSIGLNVLYVKDVTPYKVRKVRILNGVHTALVPVAYLYGIDTVREAMENTVIGRFIKDALFEEIIPTLDLPQEELEAFAAAVLERFSNPFIKHLLMSISLNSWAKFETRVLPSLLEYKKRKGAIPTRLSFSLAATIAFYKGKRGNADIKLMDDTDLLDLLSTAWGSYDGTDASLKNLVTTVLGYSKNWKSDLNDVGGLNDAVTNHLVNIERNGMQQAVKSLN